MLTSGLEMSRPLRIEYPGACYHVIARGVEKRDIIKGSKDASAFIRLLSRITDRYNFIFYAYCVMSNHYHLLLETPDGNLSRGMHNLNTTYAIGFNKRHERVGHLFQGRYKAFVVEKEEYLLELTRYIVLNPVRAGLVGGPDCYDWSSYREMMGMKRASSFLKSGFILSHFSENITVARQLCKEFVYAGLSAKHPEPIKGVVLGSEGFLQRINAYLERNRKVQEISRKERFCDRPFLRDIFSRPEDIHIKELRNKKILIASNQYGYSQMEIACHLGLHSSTVSVIIKKGE